MHEWWHLPVLVHKWWCMRWNRNQTFSRRFKFCGNFSWAICVSKIPQVKYIICCNILNQELLKLHFPAWSARTPFTFYLPFCIIPKYTSTLAESNPQLDFIILIIVNWNQRLQEQENFIFYSFIMNNYHIQSYSPSIFNHLQECSSW